MFFQIEHTPERSCLVFFGDKEGFEEALHQARSFSAHKDIDPRVPFSIQPIQPGPHMCLSLLDVDLKKQLGRDDPTPFRLLPPAYIRNSLVPSLEICWHKDTPQRILHAQWVDKHAVLHVDARGWEDWLRALTEAAYGQYWSYISYRNPLLAEEKYIYCDSETLRAAARKEDGIIPAMTFVRFSGDTESIPWLHVIPGLWDPDFNWAQPGVVKGNIIGQETFLYLLERAVREKKTQFQIPYIGNKKIDCERIHYSEPKPGKRSELRIRRIGPPLLQCAKVCITNTPLSVDVIDMCWQISGSEEALLSLFTKARNLLWTCDEYQFSGAFLQRVKNAPVNGGSISPESAVWPWVWRGALVNSVYDPVHMACYDNSLTTPSKGFHSFIDKSLIQRTNINKDYSP